MKPPLQPLLIKNARAALPDRLADAVDLVIENGKISRITRQAAKEYEAYPLVDAEGTTLFPGFIDVHIHGAVGIDTLAAEPEDLECVSRFLATKGVTGWLPTLVPAATAGYARAIKSIEKAMKAQAQETGSGAEGGARILGVHYEGPFVNSVQCGALRARFFRSFSSAGDLTDLPVLDLEFAKHMMTVAPEIEGGIELVRELCGRGWIVALGHTRADFEVLDNAFAAGAHHLTHFMNAMPPLHHRSPGPVGWGLLREGVTCDVIADGVHLDARILQLLHKLKGAEKLTLISDAIAAAGRGDGDYEIWEETITVKDGRTRNANGNIAGSVITMLEAVQLMKSLGVAEVDLARMAATNPARMLGIDEECGSIAEGKRADLVALDGQGKVVLTLIGGEPVFDARKK
jgi:N-acetylglucosamine-6-phosphate deacetylase